MFIIQDGGTSSGTHPTHPMALAAGFQMGSMHSMRSGVPSIEGSEAAMLSEAQMKKPPSGRHSARLVVSLKVQCSAVPLLHIVIRYIMDLDIQYIMVMLWLPLLLNHEVLLRNYRKTTFITWTHNNIRIYHECKGKIKKSIPRMAVWHHEACQVMTNDDLEERIFLSYPHTNKGFFFLLTTVFIYLLIYLF